MNSTTTTLCPDCGNALPPSALGGICPFCLASSVADELERRTPVGEVVVGPASYEQIGPYRILDRLGEGGYGVVYRAEQERPLQRMVAIKIMKGGAVSEQSVARFEAERQALAMMEHPSIAHVYDVGETEEGLPYFVMELIDGLPISTWCEENELSREDRLKLFRQVCEAVGHAHRRGIIHRDLKPSNILVTGEGSEALPKVIDFGIAKATEALLTERTLVTRDHQLVGTPAYMSPEQAAMTGGDVDTRSDIYSLGVLLYELLTGTTPFRVEELAKLPFDEALRKVRTEDPQRPSSRCREVTKTGEFAAAQTARFQAPVSTDLDWIVMKALEKDPERRYETAGALARDIGRYLDGDVIEARPPTAAYLATKFVRRNRVPVLAASAVLLAMVAGTIVSLAMFFRAEDEADRALKNERLAEEQAKRAEDSDLQRMLRFSRADMAQATPLLDDGRPALAVAHLVRALQTHPSYEAAATRLLYAVASENWAQPHLSFRVKGGSRMRYTPDGRRILVALQSIYGYSQRSPYLTIYDSLTGVELQRLQLAADMVDFRLDSNGKTVVTVTTTRMMEEWVIETGERLRQFRVPGEGSPHQVCLSPDGRWVACGSWATGRLQVMNRETGELVSEPTLPRQDGSFGRCEFFKDGNRVVFGAGNSLQVFDVESGEPVGPGMEHEGAIRGLALLPGEERVVSWSEDATARVWDLATGEATLVMPHADWVATGAVSPDGSRLLTGTGNHYANSGVVRLWDLATGQLIGQPSRHPGRVNEVVFSPDGLRAASGSRIGRLGDGAVRVIDAWTGKPLAAPIYQPRGAGQLALSPDGGFLAVSSRHSELAVWSLRATGMRPMRFQHGARVWRAVFDQQDGRSNLLTQSFGGETRRWDSDTGELLSKGAHFGPDTVAAFAAFGDDTLRQGLQARRELKRFIPGALGGHYAQACAQAAAASDDGALLAVGCSHGTLRLWSLETGSQVMPAIRMGAKDGAVIRVTAVAFAPGGSQLAVGSSDGVVKFLAVPSGEELDAVMLLDSEITAVAFSADGESIVAGAKDGMARFWWPGRETPLGPMMDNSGLVNWVNHFSFSPGGESVAVSGASNASRLWNTENGEPIGHGMAHIDVSTFGLFQFWTPDGEHLVTTGSHDNAARVWRARTGKMTTTPFQHRGAATAAALHPNGKVFLYGGFAARLWDCGSGEPLTPPLVQDGAVYSAVFDEAGTRFATGTFGGSAYVWDFVDVIEPLPEALTMFAGSLGGFRFTGEGVLESVPRGHMEIGRKEVAALGRQREDSVGMWMRWLAEEPSEDRTISPYSKVTVAKYIDDLVATNTLANLREALLLRPGDPVIMGKLGYSLVTRTGASEREKRFGAFLVKRAGWLVLQQSFGKQRRKGK